MQNFKIKVEDDGPVIDELERLLKIQGEDILYTIPTYPTGRTLSVEKRKRLVDLSVKYGFLLVADEVYQLQSVPHVTCPPPIFTFDEHDTVLALGDFPKVLTPALRLGCSQASEQDRPLPRTPLQ
ncbi:hypothetical protein L915_00491 [Phytophthora nicotianae]|uniref:Aminotransferase class I/classII large domain-containing protein n=2 Tax=Phytophthora nicotianae TaxID=4792 RepID=W2JV11_PHYNI|nr:hypothetical protein L915_00491 [Phytophthora nicotianae]ETL50230.1 hypothetical protein L916_00493 [Phytophthora nicotianae]ETO85875.1 hypothetical protein F444_00512 [Phytophthora nicotianae P1976]